MNHDLKVIKKKYGENMMHMCRELFPELLETEGLLSETLLACFHESHDLWRDIVKNNKVNEFRNYIISQIHKEKEQFIDACKTPSQLLSEAGYNLYECLTEEDIQRFKKYYAPGEMLCTFDGGRLYKNRVFFAVKKDVYNIKREDFPNPERQDLYGTSVISIQFTKDESHTLSIKNRYNHRVFNPDSTFSNNLDNIILGLTKSFEKYYGIVQLNPTGSNFELPKYVKAKDGKYYKFNYEINNVYYCPDNIIIDNFEVKKYPKEKYVVLDYFILDLQNKRISLYEEENNEEVLSETLKDSFKDTIPKPCDIANIKVINQGNTKEILIEPKDGETIQIELTKDNKIIGYKNNNMEEIGDYFLYKNTSLEKLELNNLTKVGNGFLYENKINSLKLPKLKYVGDSFLRYNSKLCDIDVPNLEEVGDDFLSSNSKLTRFKAPNLKIVGSSFLVFCEDLSDLDCPNLISVKDNFLMRNFNLTYLNFPNLVTVGDYFLKYNKIIKYVNMPRVKSIGNDFLENNKELTKLCFNDLQEIGNGFLYHNVFLQKFVAPALTKIGQDFLFDNNALIRLSLPNLLEVGCDFLYRNKCIKSVELPKLILVGIDFLRENNSLKKLILPNLEAVRGSFLIRNETLKVFEAPKLHFAGPYFLNSNNAIKEFYFPFLEEVRNYFLSSNKNAKVYAPMLKCAGEGFLKANNRTSISDFPNLMYLDGQEIRRNDFEESMKLTRKR